MKVSKTDKDIWQDNETAAAGAGNVEVHDKRWSYGLRLLQNANCMPSTTQRWIVNGNEKVEARSYGGKTGAENLYVQLLKQSVKIL